MSADITLADVLRGRMSTYQFLSRLFRTEVDREFYETFLKMKFPAHTGSKLVDEGYRMMVSYINKEGSSAIHKLAVDYVRAFIGSGTDGFSAAYPYESVYTSPRRLMMQNARDEVLVLYRAAGMDKRDTWREGEDHLALELEFEQVLGARSIEACENDDAERLLKLALQQRNFLQDHILSWYPMMEADLQRYARSDFYKGLGKVTSGFLENDLEFLNELIEELSGQQETAEAQEKEPVLQEA